MTVTDRVLEFFASAEEEIVYMTVEDLLTEDVLDALSEAAQRHVSIKLGGVSPEVQERIQDEIPGATMFALLWVWSDTSAGRLMTIDGRKTLVSALVNGKDASVSDPRSETAIWGAGEANSLVVVLKAIFTWRLDIIESDYEAMIGRLVGRKGNRRSRVRLRYFLRERVSYRLDSLVGLVTDDVGFGIDFDDAVLGQRR